MGNNHESKLKSIGTGRPENRQKLAEWLSINLGLEMPTEPMCPHHQTPLDYLAHSFFENHEPGDVVVWACRGGGKTMLGAVATLLDMLFKPGVQVRILGGSLEQSEKMFAYLRSLVLEKCPQVLADTPTQRRLEFKNGSRVEVLAQSDHSVRGQRVQKLRCDEVELFDPRVWQAAQLTTRSTTGARGTVEAFSTMHRPAGLMQEILQNSANAAAGSPPRKVFAWCVWDIIEKCPERRSCCTCPLWNACRGRAKNANGFMRIEDVIAMQSRVSQATWEHEMLCHPPRLEDAVFSAYRSELHERPFPVHAAPGVHITVDGRTLRLENIVCGLDFGFRHAFVCLWMAMLREGSAGRARVVWVFDELVTREKTLDRNAQEMLARQTPPSVVYCDVAGRQCNSQTGVPDERVLRNAGFTVRCRAMHIHEGIDVLNDLVAPAAGPPRLLIDPRCKRLIAAMQNYRRDRRGEPIKDGTHDHLIDALRYAVINHDARASALEVRTY